MKKKLREPLSPSYPSIRLWISGIFGYLIVFENKPDSVFDKLDNIFWGKTVLFARCRLFFCRSGILCSLVFREVVWNAPKLIKWLSLAVYSAFVDLTMLARRSKLSALVIKKFDFLERFKEAAKLLRASENQKPRKSLRKYLPTARHLYPEMGR